jgi:predicted SnoaL-like aldol condensation-catalyzing enzyme
MQATRRSFVQQPLQASLSAALVGTGLAFASLPAAAQGSKPDLERNKQTVRDFYDLAFNQSRPKEAIERYAGAQYIQHNPEVPDGKEGFIAYFEALGKRYGNKKRVEFKRMVAEGDLVVAHCRHTFSEWHGESVWAGMDIFKLDAQGKIVEHWDVLQKVPSGASNSNGMF